MKKIVITGILITLFSLILGFYNLHKAGRWTDENFYVEKGYIVVNLLKNGDFSNSYFYKEGSDHPLTAVYFYGLTSFLDLNKLENTHVSDNINIKKPIFNYDYTYSRLIPIFLSALTVLLTYLFCIRYLSFFVAVAAALILATLPHFVGFSQFVSLESWCIFTFTLAVIFSFLYFETKKTKFLVLTAIMSGITLTVKQSNILIYTFLFLFFLTQKFYFKDKIRFKNVLIFILVTVFTIFVTYPMPFFHLPDFLKSSHDLWFANGGKIPEVIFGRMMGAPIVYYFIAILITTPVLVLIFLFTGLFEILRKNRTWIYIGLILWFIVPFFMIFFTARQHMIRYIFQIYVPLSIIAAIGLDSFLKNFIKMKVRNF